MTMAALEELRTVPGSWMQVICNSRTTDGDLAWSITVKYKSDVVQYVNTSLDAALAQVRDFFVSRGALSGDPPPRKLKLKRSTP
jgi:hypothetical protein